MNDCQEGIYFQAVTANYVFGKVHLLVKYMFMKYYIESKPFQNIVL